MIYAIGHSQLLISNSSSHLSNDETVGGFGRGGCYSWKFRTYSVIYLPLSEWYAVHLYNTVLHQCLCSDQLIVAGIIHHIQDTAFPSDSCNNTRAGYLVFYQILCRLFCKWQDEGRGEDEREEEGEGKQVYVLWVCVYKSGLINQVKCKDKLRLVSAYLRYPLPLLSGRA